MTRRVVWRVAAVLITAGLLWWLLADARWQGVGARLARIDGLALAGVAALFAISYAMRGARIHGEFADEIAASGAGSIRGMLGYARILRLTLVHNALVNVVPFRGGEVAFPVLLSRWFGVPTGRAVVSLLWLRAQDAAVVLALAAVVWPGLPIGVRVVAVALVVVAASVAPWWARRHRLGGDATSTIGRVRVMLERSTRRNGAGWAWTVGNWTVKLLAETWLVALALGSGLAGAAPLGAVGAELAAILPIQGVAGFGTFEAGGAALMRTQDVPVATGLEVVLALHAVVLTLALVAGALAAMLLPGPPAAARPR